MGEDSRVLLSHLVTISWRASSHTTRLALHPVLSFITAGARLAAFLPEGMLWQGLASTQQGLA